MYDRLPRPLQNITLFLFIFVFCPITILLYLIFYPIYKLFWYILLKTPLGTEAIATVDNHDHPYDREDECTRAFYVFEDRRGNQFRGTKKDCTHWPSSDQREFTETYYTTGAKNHVLFLTFLPRLHKITFGPLP